MHKPKSVNGRKWRKLMNGNLKLILDWVWRVGFLLLLPWLVFLSKNTWELQIKQVEAHTKLVQTVSNAKFEVLQIQRELIKMQTSLTERVVVIENTRFKTKDGLEVWQELGNKASEDEVKSLERRINRLHGVD